MYVDERRVSPLILFYFQRRDAKYARERGRNEVTHRCHVCRLAFRISEENTSHDWLVIFFWGSSLTISITTIIGTPGGAVGWGTALQAGRSRVRFTMVSLEFFTDALWPWGWLRLTEMSIRNISWGGVKAAGAYGWQPYHLHVPIVLKSGGLILLETSGPVQACNGIALLLL